MVLVSALSTGGYAGQVQGGYGKRSSETTLHAPLSALYSKK